MTVRLLHGDCVELMRRMPDCSVDAVVTDPPYELGFMGKAWDGAGIAYSVQMWAEALRVLKPGGHLLAFGGTRTYHRMACAIEDAGFEIRDSIHWVYGSGFPKSLNIGKAIDKAAGAEREVVGTRITGAAMSGKASGESLGTGGTDFGSGQNEVAITAPATEEARRWEGWGTALKPAHEPVVVARKPLSGTVAANVLGWGTGGLNIDGCRVGTEQTQINTYSNRGPFGESQIGNDYSSKIASGRWPANVVFDRAAGDALDKQSGTGVSKSGGSAGPIGYHSGGKGAERFGHDDRGGASRFFTQADWGPDDWPFVYQAKPSRKERNAGLDGLPEQEWDSNYKSIQDNRPHTKDGYTYKATTQNTHPTVKPVALMRHLVRLVTPPGGVVLDPFAGSGTTLVAAVLEGFDAVGCEMTEEYLPIIEGRVAWAEEQMWVRAELDKVGAKQERLL